MSDSLSAPYFYHFYKDADPTGWGDTIGTTERNINFVLAHYGFIMFNLLNVFWIIGFEGYIFRNLSRNILHQIVLVGCISQVLSCASSLIRYNINDEFGHWAVIGTVTGNASFFFLNSAVSVVFVKGIGGSDRRQTVWKIISGFWFVYTTASSIISTIWWDTVRFEYFRPTVPISIVYAVIAMSYCLVRFQKCTMTIDPSVIAKDTMERLLKILIGLNIISFALMSQRMTLFLYPLTGWTFTVCVIFTKYAGQIEVVRSNPTGEGSDLLPS